jgi:GC-rich sequence DNA-binding factor-like protein
MDETTTDETPTRMMSVVAASSHDNNDAKVENTELIGSSEPTGSIHLEEVAEDKESKEAQRTADDYFQSLLQQAQSKRQQRRQHLADADKERLTPTVPMTFGSASHPDHVRTSSTQTKKDPAIAKWEKHEKGIGSKLLFKMGWEGSGGLGSNRRKSKPLLGIALDGAPPSVERVDPKVVPTASSKKGISQPIEVVVRPANLGLGFGSFKEQSQLTVNRKIEAEVRGIQLPESNKKKRRVADVSDVDVLYDGEEDDSQPSGQHSSSALPSTQELMMQMAWKRRKTKRVAPKIIPYEDLVKMHEQSRSEGPVIIDMRGPSANASATTAEGQSLEGKVPLGEELLHNVTFMLNTHENQLHSHSHSARSTNRKEKSLQSEILDLKRQQGETRDRLQKLEETLSVLQRVEDLVEQPSNDNNQHVELVLEWIQELAATFSSEDRQALKFWQALAPALLSPVLQLRLEQWDPLGSIDATRELLDFLFHIQIKDSSTEDEQYLEQLRFSILQNLLLPRVQQVLESSTWDPCTQTAVVVDMYEYMISLASIPVDHRRNEDTIYSDDNVLNGSVPHDVDIETSKHNKDLAEIVRKQIVLETVYPKLQAALSHWKPSLANGRPSLHSRLDLWILPWMPHLDHPGILSNVLSECKRKLKSSLSYLQRTIGKVGGDLEFVQACTATMKPWARVFDSKLLQRMISEYTTPYLARAMAKQPIHQTSTGQDWTLVRISFDLHCAGLLSDIEFLSVFEAELLPRWVARLCDMLVLREISATEAAAIYVAWKSRIMLDANTQTLARAQKLLRDDATVCAIFYTVLRMIEHAAQRKMKDVEGLLPPHTNYFVASARRNKAQQQQLQDDIVRMESRSKLEVDARIRLRRRQVDTPTFRDVVEEFARERDILFQPRMGAKALKDGKQVFLFGSVPIYIEGDVIYANLQALDWRPTSLDQLMESATGSNM